MNKHKSMCLVRTSTYWYATRKVCTFSIKYVLLSWILYSVRTKYILIWEVHTRYVLLGVKSTYWYVLWMISTFSNGAVQGGMILWHGTNWYVPVRTEYVLRVTIPDEFPTQWLTWCQCQWAWGNQPARAQVSAKDTSSCKVWHSLLTRIWSHGRTANASVLAWPVLHVPATFWAEH